MENIGHQLQLSFESKIITYKAILKPIQLRGIQLWGRDSDWLDSGCNPNNHSTISVKNTEVYCGCIQPSLA